MKDAIFTQLLDHRSQLLAYVRKKISNRELAEDVLQESLLKALRSAPELRDENKILPWFYRILRNAIIDVYRHSNVEATYRATTIADQEPAHTPEDEAVLCACFRELLPTLKPEYAELIERMDLSDSDPAEVAHRLGISRNNLKVRWHRARQALRERLEESCRLCARHGCMDCDCQKQDKIIAQQV